MYCFYYHVLAERERERDHRIQLKKCSNPDGVIGIFH